MAKTDEKFIGIAEAAKFFELGVISGFTIVREAFDSRHWNVIFIGKELRNWTLATKLGHAKSFSSVDTAVRQVEQIAGRPIDGWAARW